MFTAAAATIVAKPYWAFARVLARSFRQWHPEIPFFVLVADEMDEAGAGQDEPFKAIPWHDLALPHPERLRFRYAQQPLSYACTPFLLEHLLDRGFQRVVFFKQETLVLASVAALFDRLATASVLLTPHLVSPPETDAAARELNILLSGTFNVGVLGVSDRPAARRLLAWWQDRLTTGCRHDVAAGMHFEQRWLDLAAAYCDETAVLRDPSYNVAHWNLPDRRLTIGHGGEVLVNGEPCRVFRFSGFDPERPTVITRYNTRLSWDGADAVGTVFAEIHRRLIAEGHDECRQWPYAWAAFDNGVAIPELARRLYLDLGDGVAGFGDPRATAGADSFWQWLITPEPPGPVSRLWMAVYRSRPDVQLAFPDVPGNDTGRFLAWAATSGVAEHAIDAALLPETSR